MKQNWFRKCLVLLLTLTMVLGTFNVSFAFDEELTPQQNKQTDLVNPSTEPADGQVEEEVLQPEEQLVVEEEPVQEELIQEGSVEPELSQKALGKSIGALLLGESPEPSGTELIYNGSSQKLGSEGTNIDATHRYIYKLSTELDISYSTDIPTGINADDYEVVWKYQEKKTKVGIPYWTDLKKGSFTTTIAKKALTVSWSDTTATYNRASHKPSATLSGVCSGDTAFILNISGAQTNVGNYTASVTSWEGTTDSWVLADNNYYLENQTTDFKITPATIDSVTISGNTQFVCDNNSKKVTVGTVKAGDLTLNQNEWKIEKDELNKVTDEATEVDNYTLKVVSDSTNFDGEAEASWSIVGKGNLSDAIITLDKTSAKYSDQGITNSIKEVKYKDGTILEKGKDYTIDNDALKGKAVGKYSVKITAIEGSNYEGTQTAEWEITGTSLEDCYIKVIDDDLKYDGNQKTADVEVYQHWNFIGGYSDQVESSRYSVSNNTATDAGSHVLTVTGIPGMGYTDSKTADWKIAKGTPSVELSAKNNLTYNGSPQVLTEIATSIPESEIHLEYAVLTSEIIPGESAFSSNLPSKTDADTYYVYYRIKSDSLNWDDVRAVELGYEHVKVTIDKKSINDESIGQNTITRTYSGLPQEPLADLVLTDSKTNKTLKLISDYNGTVDTETNAGTWHFNVVGAGNYTGTRSIEWTLAKSEITSVVGLNTTFEYDGKSHTPTYLVYSEGTGEVPLSASHYEVGGTDSENNVGSYSLTVNGTGNYTGRSTLNWSIVAGKPNYTVTPINGLEYTGAPQQLVNASSSDGSASKFIYIVKKVGEGATLLPPSVDSDEWGSAALEAKAEDAGYYAVYYKVHGATPNYKDVVGGVLVHIAKAELSKDNVTLVWTEGGDHVYNGDKHSVSVKVQLGEEEITNGDWYIMPTSVTSATNAGTYHVYVSATLDGNFTDKGIAIDQTWTIDRKDIGTEDENKKIVQDSIQRTYTGALQQPLLDDLKLTDSETRKQLVLAQDFLAEINPATNVGEYHFTVAGVGNYKGTKEIEWEIVQDSIESALFIATDTVYNGENQTPAVIGHKGGLISGDLLINGTDFEIVSAKKGDAEVDLAKLKDAGTYELTVQGINNFEGEKTVSWTIKQASLDMTVNAKTGLTYNGEEHDLVTVRVTQGATNPSSITKKYIVKKVGEDYNLLPPDANDSAWNSAKTDAQETDAGYYAVYCRAESTDGNYKPIVGGALVHIAKAELSKDNVALVKTEGDDYIYNGDQHSVSVKVKIGDQEITNGGWYIMPTSVTSATNAGTYHVYVSATLGGNFTDKGIAIDMTWTIDRKNIGTVDENKKIAQNEIIRTYNGLPQQPLVSDLILSDLETDEQLYVTKDFLAEIEPRIDAGEYTFTIYGTGNYSGHKDIKWKIREAKITSVVGINTTFGYDGKEHTPTYLVYSSEAGILPLATTSYTTSGDITKTSVGSYTLIIVGKDNFIGSTELSWEIVKGMPSFDIASREVEYTGSQQDLVSAKAKSGVRSKKPQIKFIVEKVGEGAIADILTNKYGVDSDAWKTASGRARATDAGYYAVFYKVYGDKNHKDVTGCVISRITKATLTDKNIQLWPNEFTYDGSDKSTKVYVSYKGKRVSEANYYIVNAVTANSVLTARDAGTYHVYVSATLGGNFTDEGIAIDKTWTIKKAVQTGKVNINSWVWCDTPSTPWMTDLKEDANVTYEYAVRGTDVENGEWSKTQPSAIGAYTVRATIDETKNYEKAVVTADFSIGSLYYKALTIEPIAEQLYTGNEIKPGIVVKHGGYTLREGADYTIAYTNNVEPGTATVKVVFVGYYYGTYTTTFDIYGKPGTVMTVKAKTLKGPAVQLTWSKIEGAENYVVYGNQCGKKYKKLKTTTSNTLTVKKIAGKKLVAHKSYKFYVVALDAEGNALAKTNSIHYVVQKTKGNAANATKVTVSKKNVVLDVGKTSKIKAKVKVYKNKKHLAKSHGAELRFTSNNTDVATVNSKGVITAVRPGPAKITVQDVSGAKTTVQVTVR